MFRATRLALLPLLASAARPSRIAYSSRAHVYSSGPDDAQSALARWEELAADAPDVGYCDANLTTAFDLSPEAVCGYGAATAELAARVEIMFWTCGDDDDDAEWAFQFENDFDLGALWCIDGACVFDGADLYWYGGSATEVVSATLASGEHTFSLLGFDSYWGWGSEAYVRVKEPGSLAYRDATTALLDARCGLAPSPTPAPTATPAPTGEWCARGVVAPGPPDVCCAASCGACGGWDCDGLDGGPDACCTYRILNAGRRCNATADEACVVPGPAPTTAPTWPPVAWNATVDAACPDGCTSYAGPKVTLAYHGCALTLEAYCFDADDGGDCVLNGCSLNPHEGMHLRWDDTRRNINTGDCNTDITMTTGWTVAVDEARGAMTVTVQNIGGGWTGAWHLTYAGFTTGTETYSTSTEEKDSHTFVLEGCRAGDDAPSAPPTSAPRGGGRDGRAWYGSQLAIIVVALAASALALCACACTAVVCAWWSKRGESGAPVANALVIDNPAQRAAASARAKPAVELTPRDAGGPPRAAMV